MIQAKLNDGTFIIGIDAENVRRMQAGNPLVINLPRIGGTDLVYVMYGTTLQDVADELQKLNGGTLPPPEVLPERGMQ